MRIFTCVTFNNSYKKEVLLESFITSIWCSANRFLHTEITRADKALGEIFDWQKPYSGRI